MKVSSIFSFDTLTEIPVPGRSCWLALGVLALIRVGFYFFSDFMLFVPQDAGRYYALRNDARYLNGSLERPEAIVLGTSRLTGLKSEYLAEGLGISEDRILNYAVPGFTFWHAKTFFERHPALLDDCRVVVIDLLPFQLYHGDVFSEEAGYFSGLLDFGDKAKLSSGRIKAIHYMDSIVPAWSERRRVREWRMGVRMLSMAPEERRDAFLNYVQPLGMEDLQKQAIGDDALAAYSPNVLSKVQVDALMELPEMLPSDCNLILMWLPVEEEYRESLENSGAAGVEYRKYKGLIESVEHPRLKVLWIEDDSVIGLEQGDFMDLVHYTEPGMEKLGAFLLELLPGVQGRN